MLIGELAARSGLSVRTLRFYADAGVIPESGRSPAGYRLFGPDAMARARLVRTLRELGIGLDDIQRVLTSQRHLDEVVADHERALGAQIRVLRLQRSVLRAYLRSNDRKELHTMTDLTALTSEERRRIVDDYLDAVFGTDAAAVADKMRMGAPELPDDPTPEQLAAWVELVELLRDPEFVATSRRMAQRAEVEGPEPDVAQFEVGKAIGATPPEPRAEVADRIDAFNDRRVAHYWTLVGIINDWPPSEAPTDVADAWAWYSEALRAHPQR